MKKPNWLIVEKPSFNKSIIPTIKISAIKYCYLLPTGCGFSKSVSELKFNSDYSDNKKDVYDCKSLMITYAYTFFFLWFRLHISFKEKEMSSSLMERFKPLDKSLKSLEEFLK